MTARRNRISSNWTTDQQNCRAYGHPWRPHLVTTIPKRGGYEVVHICYSCTAQRAQVVDVNGYPVTNWKISYPEGYLLKGHGRLTRDDKADVRLAALTAIARSPRSGVVLS